MTEHRGGEASVTDYREMNDKIESLLEQVQKAPRYTGGEMNAIRKPWDSVKLHYGFCFPDTYEVGMSHLGMKILYGLVNQEPDQLCERFFMPWLDMKELMDDYWKWLKRVHKRTLHEKDTQHALCISNTESTDYTIIDLEFQVSTRKDCIYHYEPSSLPRHPGIYVCEKSPRFDIIAVRNSDRRLCVIELKNGLDALVGKSGIGDHADSFEGSIGKNPLAELMFTKEMEKVVSDKKRLKLLSDDFYIDEKLPIEFIYAYAFKSEDENGKKVERDSFIREQEKASCMNYKVIYLNKGDFTLSDSNY
jgi:hypothetical protein